MIGLILGSLESGALLLSSPANSRDILENVVDYDFCITFLKINFITILVVQISSNKNIL